MNNARKRVKSSLQFTSMSIVENSSSTSKLYANRPQFKSLVALVNPGLVEYVHPK